MGIFSQGGSQHAAEDVRGFVNALIFEALKSIKSDGDQTMTVRDHIRELEKVRDKCEEIIKVAEAGWY